MKKEIKTIERVIDQGSDSSRTGNSLALRRLANWQSISTAIVRLEQEGFHITGLSSSQRIVTITLMEKSNKRELAPIFTGLPAIASIGVQTGARATKIRVATEARK